MPNIERPLPALRKGYRKPWRDVAWMPDTSSKNYRRLEGRIFTSLCLLFDGLPYFDLERGDV